MILGYRIDAQAVVESLWLLVTWFTTPVFVKMSLRLNREEISTFVCIILWKSPEVRT
jgi:hypothetical protein